jgi:hypothetical protein
MSNILLVLLEILKYVLPAAIVAGTSYFLIKQFLDAKSKQTLLELRLKNRQDLLPTKFQAYERLLLFLERCEPANLLLRVHRPGMSAEFLQAELLRTIREEYEHNLTQQLYVSTPTWKMVQEAKDTTLQLVRIANSRMGKTSTGIDLSSVIFEIIEKSGASPTQGAIDALKQEARELL